MESASTIAVAYDCLYPYTTGGGERQYRAFATRFHAKGQTVEYLTSVQWPAETPPAQDDFRVVAVTGALRLYDSAGRRRTPAALRYAWGLFRSLLRRRRKYRAVIVSGLPVLNVFAARAALIGSGTRIVVDYLEVWGRRQWIEYAGSFTGTLAWLLQRMAIAITPIATCHSELSARRLRAEGFARRLLVSPGLIQGDSTAQPQLNATRPPFVLYAGRHIPDKRVEIIPAAVARARATIPNLHLVVLGDGPTSAQVDAAIRSVDGENWTSRPGFVSEDRLDELMGTAAVLVNPSRREGYGLVVVEAAAHGTPVVLVADEGNAATELIDQGRNGFVATTPTASDVAAAIIAAVLGGPNLRETTRSWYEDAVTTRTVERTADAILVALDE